MHVRIATYPVQEGKDIESWVEENAAKIRSAPGVIGAEFIRSTDDPRYVGAILRFGDPEDIDRYRSSEQYRDIVDDLRSNYLDSAEEVRQGHYEVLDA